MLNFLKNLFRPRANTESLNSILAGGALLVDVRSPNELKSGQVLGAINIPLNQVAGNLDTFKNQKNIIVYCRTGTRAAVAQTILQSNGITNVTNGGSWKQVNEAIQSI